ncbi:forkhead box protein G1-like [Cotesia glomerata]|uniref:forkhead box protein G1-like n=1 Tax=Cotesia glomerata TaxID=32391 RepID=UPI001D019974|nr:forkhead box protein G1-like [Cotesia glomerata]
MPQLTSVQPPPTYGNQWQPGDLSLLAGARQPTPFPGLSSVSVAAPFLLNSLPPPPPRNSQPPPPLMNSSVPPPSSASSSAPPPEENDDDKENDDDEDDRRSVLSRKAVEIRQPAKVVEIGGGVKTPANLNVGEKKKATGGAMTIKEAAAEGEKIVELVNNLIMGVEEEEEEVPTMENLIFI